MKKWKKVAKVEVVAAGSNPDVDSDFNTGIREKVIADVAKEYGEESVCGITTYSTNAARGAVKNLCTIYQVPFDEANRLSALIPPPVEGKEMSLADIFNPEHERYGEAQEFRNAASGGDWKHIIESAMKIEGKNKTTGVHACGIIISSKPLSETIPMMVRQNDGYNLTQWTYPECEDAGLIKFDFLGLDTVDIIQSTVENIVALGKEPPNMSEIIHGPMDDKKTFELFQAGRTVGIFQFGSSMVAEYCRTMKPTEFGDIVASTAILRPGPMGMGTHEKYVLRKQGIEKVEMPHRDFVGSPLEDILKETYGLVIFQESIQKIAAEIGGMTLKEGDALRKAMGKKKIKLMESMKDKFSAGAIERGYSQEAVDVLWDTVAEFAKYGFNKSHSVAYAMAAYQTAYLKAHYPAEFMSAIITQNTSKKEKILEYLKEARRMGLKVGAANINLSQQRVFPDPTGKSGFDIVYGIGGLKDVSDEAGRIIIEERERGGDFKSVKDVIDRCFPLGVKVKVFERLALAGAFDCFGVTRKDVVDNIKQMTETAKKKDVQGESLFDMFELTPEDHSEEFMLNKEEYHYADKLKKEAETIGLYLTGNPVDNIKLYQGNIKKLKDVLGTRRRSKFVILGSITNMIVKTGKSGWKRVKITIDDGENYLEASLSKDIVKGMAKKSAQEKFEKMYCAGENSVGDELIEYASINDVTARDELEINTVYAFTVEFRPPWNEGDPYVATVVDIEDMTLAHSGRAPLRVRFLAKKGKEKEVFAYARKLKESLTEKPVDEESYPVYGAIMNPIDQYVFEDMSNYYENRAREMRARPEDMKSKIKSGDMEKPSMPMPKRGEFSYRPKDLQELASTAKYKFIGYAPERSLVLLNKYAGYNNIDYGYFFDTPGGDDE